MKYLQSTGFSVGGHSKAYADNFDRIFGKKNEERPKESTGEECVSQSVQPSPYSEPSGAASALAAGVVLVLRTCAADLTSSHGFQWPESGAVAAPDWEPTKDCGNGLHGWLWGEGEAGAAPVSVTDPAAKWLVVSVAKADIVDLHGKVKFPRGEVVHCGDRLSATTYLQAHAPGQYAVIGGTATAGARGTATAGARGTATAGDSGTATAGYAGTATAGDAGTATAGDSGTATAGYAGTATAGDAGTATAGDAGTATAGDSGTATAGYAGTATAGDAGTATAGYAGTATAGYAGTATAGDSGAATAGYAGTATAGYAGTATAGYAGTATAGDSGTATAGYAGTATAGARGTATAGDSGTATAGAEGALILSWWDTTARRRRYVVGYVGEDGIEAGKTYRVSETTHDLELVPSTSPLAALVRGEVSAL